jgi:hypothetical protein
MWASGQKEYRRRLAKCVRCRATMDHSQGGAIEAETALKWRRDALRSRCRGGRRGACACVYACFWRGPGTLLRAPQLHRDALSRGKAVIELSSSITAIKVSARDTHRKVLLHTLLVLEVILRIIGKVIIHRRVVQHRHVLDRHTCLFMKQMTWV